MLYRIKLARSVLVPLTVWILPLNLSAQLLPDSNSRIEFDMRPSCDCEVGEVEIEFLAPMGCMAIRECEVQFGTMQCIGNTNFSSQDPTNPNTEWNIGMFGSWEVFCDAYLESR